MVQANADARPYALGLLMTAIMFYGFARATQLADRKGRWLFIAGGVGLFTTHYLLTLIALGIALAYLCLPNLRANYLPRKFAQDVGLQLLLVTWGLPQLSQLWSRRAELSWLGEANHFAFFEVIGPFIIAGSIAVLSGRLSQQTSSQRVMVWVFCVALLTQIACLQLLAYFGVNLLEQRYMIPILIPAVIIGAIAIEWTPKKFRMITLAYCILFIGLSFAMNFRAYGTFSTVGFQDWRQAVHCVEKLAHADEKPLVLYRSSFVEEDMRAGGRLPPSVTLSPIQNFRLPTNPWHIVPLTYTWSVRGRENYFFETVEPALRSAAVFYFLTCRNCFNEYTGKYPELFVDWIEKKFPDSFVAEAIDAGNGITLIRFADRAHGARLESILRPRRLVAPNESTLNRLVPQFTCN